MTSATPNTSTASHWRKPSATGSRTILVATTTVTGDIAEVGEVDDVQFTLSAAALQSAGGTYRLTITFASESTAKYTPKATLYSPTGERVGTDFSTGGTKKNAAADRRGHLRLAGL